MLYLGCPIWKSLEWAGSFFPPKTSDRDSLAAYSRRLNMVEGNTTFYGMPSQDLVARWRDDTPPDFRFCLKFPRVISHEKGLIGCEAETAQWIDRLQILQNRAGLSFLQLPPSFAPDQLPLLTRYLKALPREIAFAVEARHPAWFVPGPEVDLNGLLADLGIARVLYDVRPLSAADRSDPDIRRALEKKPNVPVRMVRTAPHTLVRYISHPIVSANDPWLAEWESHIANWLTAGDDVYFCMHSIHEPDMPTLCRIFHDRLATHISLPPLPDWSMPAANAQMSLF